MTTPIPTRKSVAAEFRDAARYSSKRGAAHYRYVAALLVCTSVPVEQIMAYPAPTAELGEFSRAALLQLVVPSLEEYEHALQVLAGSRGAEDFDVEYSDADRATAAAWVAQYEAANR
ncbi:hypothetical protein FK268_12670 [Tsukamurella sputi]|uniref:Uncharacterized protein n=1 Tax=Tsukamurella sputi TaxID=2591848 RepID=A0A5C5RN61_9ACTN|nr:hypothetical protein [Tsukamurella sputi]TWS24436.1 hypothetical protein FK268_12670 [Tsukamurella sputi]